MTAALEGGEWSAARPGRTLPTGEIQYPFYRRLGGPQGRSGRSENLVPTGIRASESRRLAATFEVITALPVTNAVFCNVLLFGLAEVWALDWKAGW